MPFTLTYALFALIKPEGHCVLCSVFLSVNPTLTLQNENSMRYLIVCCVLSKTTIHCIR